MRCTECGQNTPDSWQQVGYIAGTAGPKGFTNLQVEFMHCANDECKNTMIRMTENHYSPVAGPEMGMTNKPIIWMARPRYGSRPVDPVVPEPYSTDYKEAAALLDISPRNVGGAVEAHPG